MYYRRNKKPMILAVLTFILITVLVTAVPLFLSGKEEETGETEPYLENFQTEQTESETAAIKIHRMVICENPLVSVTVTGGVLCGTDEKKTLYEVREDEDVTLTVLPLSAEGFLEATVLDGEANDIPCSVKPDDNGSVTVRFTVPESCVFVSLSFGSGITEMGEENGLKYALTLDEVSDRVKKDFEGKFNAVAFLNSLGDSFSMGSLDSQYRNVRKVTFMEKNYTEDRQKGHTYHYLCFDDDDEWLILVDYDLAHDVYIFRDIKQEKEEEAILESERIKESEEQAKRESEEAAQRASEEAERRRAEESGRKVSDGTEAAEEQNGKDTPQESTETNSMTQASSFSLDNIPTAFIRYVGDKEVFFQKVYDYLLDCGKTGGITGTFDSYEIDESRKQASFQIVLNSGETISGTYSRKRGKYSFQGL